MKCGKCGARMEPATRSCPMCESTSRQQENEGEETAERNRRRRRTLWISGTLCVALLVLTTGFAMVGFALRWRCTVHVAWWLTFAWLAAGYCFIEAWRGDS